MAANLKSSNWTFYVTWIALSTLAIPLAFGGASIILALATHGIGDWIEVGGRAHITEDYLFSFVFPPLVWLFTGGLQYAVLRRYLPKMGGWFFVTALGGLLAVAALYLTHLVWASVFDATPFSGATLAIIGTNIGFAQWLLLRRRLSHMGWWILASALGWGLIAIIGLPFTSLLSTLALGFFPAITTGVVWLCLWHPPQADAAVL